MAGLVRVGTFLRLNPKPRQPYYTLNRKPETLIQLNLESLNFHPGQVFAKDFKLQCEKFGHCAPSLQSAALRRILAVGSCGRAFRQNYSHH